MNKISNAIKCMNCKSVLKSPVILPCKHSICKHHVSESFNNGSTIVCIRCGSEHVVENETAFLDNEALDDIVNAEIEELSFGKVHDDAKQACDRLTLLLDNMNALLVDSEHYTYDEIDKLKNAVVIKSEELKLLIDEETVKLVDMLSDYQRRCKHYLSTNEYAEQSNSLDALKADASSRLSEWQKALNRIKFDEDKWKSIIKESEDEIIKLQSQLECFKEDLLLYELTENQSCIDFFKSINIKSCFIHNERQKTFSFDSNIIDSQNILNFFKLCQLTPKKKWSLIYRATEDGFSASRFHAHCDNKQNGTLTIIKTSSGCIFGGYAKVTWNKTTKQSNYDPNLTAITLYDALNSTSTVNAFNDETIWEANEIFDNYKSDPIAFLFSFKNHENTPIKLNTIKGVIFCHESYGPSFGHGPDLRICDNSNINDSNYANVGSSFSHPKYKFGSAEAQKFLAGDIKFMVEEIEVFTQN